MPTANRPAASRRPAWVRSLLAAAVGAALLSPALCPWGASRVCAAPAAGAPGGPGIDGLDDDKLMSELAVRGQEKLLQHLFDAKSVPPEKREAIKSLLAGNALNNPNFQKLPASERKKVVMGVVAGIEKVLPTMNDPRVLMRNAATLIVNGTARSVNTLEYWGENPKTQGDLRPIAESVDKMLAKAAEISEQQANKLLDSVKSPNDPRIKQWEEVDGLTRLAKYNRAFAMYDLSLSIDKADAKRKDVCDKAIAILDEFDNPDAGVQVSVRLREAKLNLSKGDFKKAKELFDWVIKSPEPAAAAEGTPAKDAARVLAQMKQGHAGDVYQAKYFAIVADLEAKKIDDAKKDLAELNQWQKASLPQDKPTQDGAEAASAMMQFRINSREAELAKDGAAKRKSNDAAVAVLMELVGKRKDLAGIIFEQVLGRLPDNPKMGELDPLLLQAMVVRGIDEVNKGDDEPVDQKALENGTGAAKEIVKRLKPDATKREEADVAALRAAVLQQRLAYAVNFKGDKMQALQDAGESYLDYLQGKPANKERVALALDGALSAVAKLRSDPAMKSADRTKALYNRFLEVAYNAGRTQFAYEYGRLLMDQAVADPTKLSVAAAAFRKVPADEAKPSLMIMSRYFEMLSLQLQLSKTKPTDAEKAAIDPQILTLANDINTRIDKAMPGADEKLKTQLRSTKVQTTLIAADIARGNKDSAKVLALLGNFEESIKGLPDAQNLLGYALFLRLNAQMASNQTEAAKSTLEQYIATSKGDPGQTLGVIATLLGKIDEAYQDARTKNDADGMKQVGRQRIELADLLVKQVEKNPSDPNARQYRLFWANALREQMKNEPDQARKQEIRGQALTAYKTVQKDAKEGSPEWYGIQRYLALIAFDAGDYVTAQKVLADLAERKVIGSPMIEVVEVNGETSRKPNEVYWETIYKLMVSDLKLAETDKSLSRLKDEVVVQLKRNYIQWGDNVGGSEWKKPFAELRKDVLGDWSEDAVPAPATTKPAEARADRTEKADAKQ